MLRQRARVGGLARRYCASSAASSSTTTPPDDEKEALEATMKLAPMLTPEEMEERERLLTEGFSSWTRKDLANFVRGASTRGRAPTHDHSYRG